MYKPLTKDIYISVTRKCNFACGHCYCKDYLSDKTVPTLKKIDHCLSFIQKLTHLKSITLIGGEPFINKRNLFYLLDSINAINRQRKEKIKVVIFTNGSICIDLHKYKGLIEEIIVAIAGFGEGHDRIRFYKKTNRGSFKNIVKNFNHYVQQGLYIRFQYVVNQKNITQLFPSIENIIQEIPVLPGPIGVQFDHFTPWGKYPFKIIGYYFDILRLNKKYKKLIVVPHHFAQVDNTYVCTAGTSFFGIDLYSGKIHGCHENNGSAKDIIGNITQGISTKKINTNMHMRNLRKYKYAGIPRQISYYLFKIFGGKICPMRNKHHCKNTFTIPLYFLFIHIFVHLFRSLTKKDNLPLL